MSERILLRFSKKDSLKWIGHLDLLRVFQQTVRRAGLPVAYSQGFNPHQLMGFALPLPLGMESENDYAEITLEETMEPETLIQHFNERAPRGLTLTGARPVKTQADGRSVPGAAALTAAADYAFSLGGEASGFKVTPAEVLASVLAEQNITIPKKTKTGVRDTDIRPDIFDLRMENEKIIMRLAAGSARFLNPVLAAGLLYERAGVGQKPHAASMTRLELYRHDPNHEEDLRFYPLFEAL